ncbi:protein Star isoform X2 [Anabrus simplex]|uniref:protein Star isoform X2 n=1 Tax=Anabrus simplex TaxID=316456 RepID=UPI0035A29E12
MVAPLLSPGLPRRLLPFAVFLTAFSIVMMILFMSMDIKALKHREQFNFSQDLDFHTVAQDNPQFIAYIRAIHLQLPPVFRNTADNASHIMNALPQNKLVARLLGYKKGGVFVEAGAYQHGRPSDTEWLELALGWHGLLVQPDPRDFLVLQRQRRHKALSVHACLSPTSYPKEVLKTLPFDQVRIEIISVDRHRLNEDSALVAFMVARSYKLVEVMNTCYIFKKENVNVLL